MSNHYFSIITYSFATIGDYEHSPNKHASGGISYPDIHTLEDCKAACYNDDACESLDWE